MTRGQSARKMKKRDTQEWVTHQHMPPPEQSHVRFERPPTPSEADSEEEDPLADPPVYLDGGYGWIIVFLSFCMHCIVDGSSFCMGLFYADIRKEFDVDHIAAMQVAGTFLALPLLLAPVAGLFTDVFGCRAAILVGAIICTICSTLASFCTEYTTFMWSLGVGCGIGMSFIYNAAIVLVTYYFRLKIGLATSIAVAGTGFGVCMYPPFISIVKEWFFLVMSPLRGVMTAYSFGYFGLFIIGLIVKDVEWTSDSIPYKEKQFEKLVEICTEQQYDSRNVVKEGLTRRANSLPNLAVIKVDFGSIQSVCDAKADGKMEVPTRSKSVAFFDNSKPNMNPIPEYSMINTVLANLEHLDLELANSPCTTVRAQRRRVTSKISMSVDQINELDDEDFKISNLFHSRGSSESDEESSSEDSEMSNDGDSSSSELSEKKLLEPTSYLTNRQSTVRALTSAPNSARLRTSIVPGSKSATGGRVMASNAIQSQWTSNLIKMGKIPSAPMLVAGKKRKNWIKRWNLDVALTFVKQAKENTMLAFQSRVYNYLVLSVMCLYATLDVPYCWFFDYSVEVLEVQVDTANAIYSCMGLSTCVATFVFGALSDRCDKIKKPSLVFLTYFIAMVVASLSPFGACIAFNGACMIGIAIWYGLCVSGNYVLQSILITKIFDKKIEVFQMAYSMVGFLEGIASFFGPLVFGKLRDETGSYWPCFILSGFFMLLSGFFALLMYYEWVKEEKRRAIENEEEKQKSELNNLENGILRIQEEYPRNGDMKEAERENLLYP